MMFIVGVTLIEEITVMTLKGLTLQNGIIIGLLLLLLGIICLVYIKTNNETITGVLIVAFIVFMLFDYKFQIVDTYVCNIDGCVMPTGEYKVTVADDTDMNEFFRRYELIDFTDGVYIIRISREDNL